jgi:hypothetical protein
MKATLTFVPPGGGEQDYMLDFELPGVPQPGDYITIQRPGIPGTEDFIVRRTWWHLSYSDNKLVSTSEEPRVYGEATSIVVECEFARGMFSSDAHKRACAMYKGVKDFEASGY